MKRYVFCIAQGRKGQYRG